MVDTEVDRAIDDAKCADQEFFIRDENCKVFTDNNTNSNILEDNLENSDLDLASNLGLTTEIDNEKTNPIRRSKRLTKTNPIFKYDNPNCHDYRNHRKTMEFGGHTESTRCSTGEERRQPLDRSKNQIQRLRSIVNRKRPNCQEQLTVLQTLYHWRIDGQNRKQNGLIGRSPANSGGECRGQTNSTRN